MEQPFHDLEIFKEQTARNIVRLSPDDKVSELVQADKDAEIVLMGLLKGHMLDLYEALSWQYASKEDVESKRRRLLAACEERLEILKKEYLPALAREHGISKEFCAALKEPENCTVDDYERLADLDFGLMVWRQNLKRSTGLASTRQEREELVRSAYVKAEALVKRCLGNSHKVWNQMARWSQMSAPRQSAYAMAKSPPRRSASMSDAPLGGDGIITVYERAMAQVWLRLEAIAQQHGVADALQALPRMDGRSGSHPLSFGQVAVALDQVTKALDAGKAPQQAQDMALRVASDAPINPPVLRQGADNTAQSAKIQAKPMSTTVVTEE